MQYRSQQRSLNLHVLKQHNAFWQLLPCMETAERTWFDDFCQLIRWILGQFGEQAMLKDRVLLGLEVLICGSSQPKPAL